MLTRAIVIARILCRLGFAFAAVLSGGLAFANESCEAAIVHLESARASAATKPAGEAMRDALAALWEVERSCERGWPKVAAFAHLAYVSYRLAQHDQARNYAQAARAMLSDVPPAERDRAAVVAEGIAGFLAFQAGRSHEALPHMEAAFLAARRHFGPTHRETLTRQKNLALVRFDLGRNDEALEMQRELVAQSLGDSGIPTSELISRRTNLVAFMMTSGQLQAGLEELAEVRRLSPAGGQSMDAAILDFFDGYARRRLGDPISAAARLRAALAVQERLAGRLSPSAIASRGELAVALAQNPSGRDMALQESQAAVRDALALAQQEGQGGASRTTLRALAARAETARELGEPTLETDALMQLVAFAELYRERAQLTDELERTRFGVWVPHYRRLAWLMAQTGEIHAALALADAARARLLADDLRAARMQPAAVSFELTKSLQLEAQVLAAENALADARFRAAPASEIELRLSEHARAFREFRNARLTSVTAFDEQTAPVAHDAAAWRARGLAMAERATDRHAVLSWIFADPGNALMVLHKREVRLFVLNQPPSASAMRALYHLSATPPQRAVPPYWPLAEGGYALSVTRPSGATGPPVDAEHLRREVRRGLVPAAAGRWLAGVRGRITMIAEGELARLSPALLFEPSQFAHGIAVAASVAGALDGAAPSRRIARPWMAVVGDSPELKHARSEVAHLAKHFGVERVNAAQIGAQQLSAVLQAAGLVHFALHGRFDGRSPMRSAVVPSASGPPIRASEISLWRFANRPLITLAACESAALGEVAGDAALGLPYGLKVAGAAAVLATLWPVDDAATSQLMRVYYGRLRAGSTPPEALLAAQHHLSSGKAGLAWRAPFYWAGFVLYL